MAESKLVDVVYVGKKPQAFDNVAQSHKVWNGSGDVQAVTEQQARILIKYPDQWKLADANDTAAVNKPAVHSTSDADGNKVNVTESDLKKPVEKMNKNELVVYAKEKFGKDLDPALGKKQMLDELEAWEKEIDPIGLV